VSFDHTVGQKVNLSLVTPYQQIEGAQIAFLSFLDQLSVAWLIERRLPLIFSHQRYRLMEYRLAEVLFPNFLQKSGKKSNTCSRSAAGVTLSGKHVIADGLTLETRSRHKAAEYHNWHRL
jgi:hypothetical protein